MPLPSSIVLLAAKPNRILVCLLVLSTIFSTLSCSKKDAPKDKIPADPYLEARSPILVLRPSSETGIDFRNIIEETFEMNITTHINTSNGGGVAVLDANLDGLQDLYFISSSGENRFYLNEGNFKFKDITPTSGLASAEGFEVAVTVVDINEDGYPDIYVCRAGPVVNEARRNKLYINNKDLTFREEAATYHLDDPSASMGANFFDYDHDGDLDLYLLNYPVDFGFSSKINVKPNSKGDGVEPILDPIGPYDSDRLYRNDGPPQADGSGGFTDVSKKAGIWNFGYGLSVSVEDFNQDGWMDVYVANDFIQPDLLYINNHDGTFTNQLAAYFKHTTQHSMGTDLSDFDNDGNFDLFAVDMLSYTQFRRKTLLSTNSQNKYTTLIRNGYFEPVVRNVLQHNNGNGTFSDLGCLSGVFQTDWSWSGLMADIDNDGWKDILVTNGYQREVTDVDFINFTFADIKAKGSLENQFKDVHDFLNMIPQYKLHDFVFKNNRDWTFQDMSGQWMTNPPTWSNGAATADLDNDGDLDYIVNNIADEAFVYENKAAQLDSTHYLQVALDGPPSNHFGIGTRINLYSGSNHQYTMISPTRGIFSSIQTLAHFGLGSATNVDSLLIIWPDGKKERLLSIPANQRITVKYENASTITSPVLSANTTPLFKDITSASTLNFRHTENDYIDFETNFLMPWALSDLGPLCATADINQDGLTDVYIGNSFGKSGGLYLQDKNGTFSVFDKSIWATDSIYEDHGALFFDVDLDGDSDLLVLSGGYESVSPEAWKHRLYINDQGKRFIPAHTALPKLKDVCLRAVAYDYDDDQDLDLFLGGRISPGHYPETPQSYILRNDRNRFTDVTAEVSSAFGTVGMVNDLKLANLDEDPMMELVVAGEWMPITVFKIGKGKVEKMDADNLGLDKSNGFWNRLEIADLDQDGDADILAGNLGLNTQYRPTAEYPVQCYSLDIDKNGSLDPVITYYEDGKCYPMVQKDVLIKQVPVLKKKFIYAKDYATATIEDVLSSSQMKEASVLNCYMILSGWWENNAGKFSFHPFPNPAQASPIMAISVADVNQDQVPDIFMAGNKYRMEVETGRLDAGNGTLLLGHGKGQFTWMDNRQSGLWAQKEVRDIAVFPGPEGRMRILITNNNDKAQLYENTFKK